MLGEALEALFGVRLTIGPHVEEGFYYDCYMGDRTLTDAEKPLIERKIEQASFPAYPSACMCCPASAPGKQVWAFQSLGYSHRCRHVRHCLRCPGDGQF